MIILLRRNSDFQSCAFNETYVDFSEIYAKIEVHTSKLF